MFPSAIFINTLYNILYLFLVAKHQLLKYEFDQYFNISPGFIHNCKQVDFNNGGSI